MSPGTIALLFVACATTAVAQEYEDPVSEWALERPRSERPATPPPARKAPPAIQEPAPKPADPQPAGPRVVAKLPGPPEDTPTESQRDAAPDDPAEGATPPPIPEVVVPAPAPREPDPQVRNGRRLRMDSSFSALEATEPAPAVTPPGDSSEETAAPRETTAEARPRAAD
jgi:hypothetical protein